MDKFLVKSRVKSITNNDTSPRNKQLRQTTIESLQGVVVIEDIMRHKSKLQLPNQSKDVIIESLKELSKKIPPRNVMLDTNIGKIVNKYRKHTDNEISTLARRVYVKWKNHFQDHLDRPKIEVKCDAKTEKMRAAGKRFLSDALSLELTHPLPDAIERETFYSCKRLINSTYRKTMRTLVFTLRHTADVKKSVLNSELSVEDFVKKYKK
ncbi:transcription elongation factor A N-terminal and central domain-containing protein 2-like [Gigantopelta aegis]|uniref:transcription elongation factor A N-terminal and central domain-containing protein 2-like n=1 Tax=Gigantopelta aegis TaxID=1735272 RepID=UPI001B88CE9C|nr:transcription elongation factor A N-terminal and central domain-containing protein 2-like [Gigantopelta aegis]